MSLFAPDDARPSQRRMEAGPAADIATLPSGTRLAEFELLGVLGNGGFGVVYLAQDLSLGRRVALKEYMPSSLALRSGLKVSLRSPRYAETFAAGLRSFVNEAQLLARFDHPSLVKVYRFWEANGTAYMVMPYYEGTTLKRHLEAMASPPTQAWLLQLLEPLIDALAAIHAQHCYHRDISPDNILVLAGSGKPLLLDFGAARRVISDMTQPLTVILKPGFAPLEQYDEVPEFKQGPWTDVYALCAVVHFVITGRTPPPALGRMLNDNFAGLVDLVDAGYTPAFLRAIERGLRLRPDERTPTVQALAADLGLRPAIDLEVEPDESPPAAPAHGAPIQAIDLDLGLAPAALAHTGRTIVEPGEAAGRTHALRPEVEGARASPPQSSAVADSIAEAASPGTRRGRRRWAFAALGALILAGAATWIAVRGDATSLDAAVDSPVPPPAGAVARAAAAPAASPGQRMAREFDRIDAAQHADYQVEAVADKPRLRIGRDRLSFSVRSSRDGFVYVLVFGPDDSLLLLFPNSVAADNRIRAGQPLQLPQKTWPLEASDPPGPEQFITIVSAHRRDFSALRPVTYSWFQRLAVEAVEATPQAGGSAYAGIAQCADAGCDRYGAARFSVTVER